MGFCSGLRSSLEVLPEELCSLGPYGTWAAGAPRAQHWGGGLRVGVPSLTPVPLGAMLSCRLWEQQRQL